MVKIGIIGGSGLDDPKILRDGKEIEVDTPYGRPSSPLTTGKIKGVDVVILSRHGKKHTIMPSNVNYRANIWALKELGCTHIIATSACGSLKGEIKPGHLVFVDQFIDRTTKRHSTFYDQDRVCHIPMAEPFCPQLRDLLIKTAEELGLEHHKKGTVITIEGSRFSTKAESHMFRNWGADVVNMSTVPEVVLAKEAGLCYQIIAMSTDYDCWHEAEKSVDIQMVLKIMAQNAENVKRLISKVIPEIKETKTCGCDELINGAVIGGDTEKIIENVKADIKSKIRTVPHFPKKGIMFRDITTLIKDAEGFKKVIDELTKRYKDKNIDAVVGIESRGFIFGGALAYNLGKGFVPIRKPGKLPAETVSQEYSLEYGTDKVEIHKDAISPGQNILIVDDLLATGGTCSAAAALIEKLGGKIVECAFVIDLPDLKGKEKLNNYPVFTMVEFEGD